MGRGGLNHPIRLIARGAGLLTVGLLTAVLVLAAQGAAPARADPNCPVAHFNNGDAGVTGSYSGTWTYENDQPQMFGLPNIVGKETLTWSESLNANTSDCWTLNSVGGSITLTGAGTGSGGGGGDCSASISLAGDAASNFSFDQTNSAGIGPNLGTQDPGTGATTNQNWYLEENVPNFYGDPEGVLETSDQNQQDYCYHTHAGYQPVNNTMFTGGGCHIGPYYGGGPVDYVSFPVQGGGSASDSCQYTSVDNQGNTTTETLSQSATLNSSLPTCADASASTTSGKPVTITLSCSIANSQPLVYNVATQPASGSAFGGGTGAQVTYTPKAGFTGTDHFTYSARLTDGLPSLPATVTVTVTKKKKPKKPPKKKPPPKPTGCGKGVKRGTTARVAHARSETLPRNYCSYFWVAGVDGTSASSAITKVSWKQSLKGTATRLRAPAISAGRSATQLGSFSSGAPAFGLGGVAVRGYKVLSTHTAVAHGRAHRGKGKAAAPSAKVSVRTSAGQVLLVLAAGQSTSSLSISGVRARSLAGRTFTTSGSRVSVGAWSVSPPKGSQAVVVRTTVPVTNSGTTVAAVVYVLGPG